MIVRYQINYDGDVYDVRSMEIDPIKYVVTAVTIIKNEELVRVSEDFTLKSWTWVYDTFGHPIYTGDRILKDNKIETIPDPTSTRSYCKKLT